MFGYDKNSILLIIGGIIILGILLGTIIKFLSSRFHYPYFEWNFNVSGKRNVKIENELDKFLINNGWDKIAEHNEKVLEWKKQCEEYLDQCILKKYRTKQYNESLDDKNAYTFNIVRNQTRYKQVNYVKTPYKVSQIQESYSVDYEYLFDRYNKLESINFETTLSNYHSRNQRKLLTPKLREKIKQRDNYTCQLCGKYMPDEIGLQIDHIIPIAKGGKSVESNLQVLCSKCNANKSAKMPLVDDK